MEYPNYSVLMSVYKKENPAFLRESMMSIYNQTVPTNDFVLVCDGPLTEGLDAVINEMQCLFGERLYVHRLDTNNGLGIALNNGLKCCRNELVARMDSDDISRENRCETQLKAFVEHPSISIISGTVEEFDTTIASSGVVRSVPEKNREIVEFAKKRNPFNHPCVMYKKSSVDSVGGYQDFYLLEDYYLWIRMLRAGYEGYNLQIPLLWMRAGSGMYKRRGGLKYAKSQLRLLKYMYQNNFITWGVFLVQGFIRLIISLMPSTLRQLVFSLGMRKKKR